MPKNIRRRISQAIRTTFRLSCSRKSRGTSWNTIDHALPIDQSKSTSNTHDYIDLSECYSSSSDSEIVSMETNQHRSTKLYNDDSSSFCTLSNISPIPHHQLQYAQTHTKIQPSCHCPCHQLFDQNQWMKYHPKMEIRTKIYPLIF